MSVWIIVVNCCVSACNDCNMGASCALMFASPPPPVAPLAAPATAPVPEIAAGVVVTTAVVAGTVVAVVVAGGVVTACGSTSGEAVGVTEEIAVPVGVAVSKTPLVMTTGAAASGGNWLNHSCLCAGGGLCVDRSAERDARSAHRIADS